MLIDDLHRYLSIRRAVGFKLDRTEMFLRNFTDFAGKRGDEFVVSQTAIDWAIQGKSDRAKWTRLDEVIRFARFIKSENNRHEIPQNLIVCNIRQRRSPYLFTDEEVARILAQADKLKPCGSLRSHTYKTIFGLLASTGMRISEVLGLCLNDLTDDGLIIRQTKFRKSRLIPLHATVKRALDQYLLLRQRIRTNERHVFISHRGGKRLHYDIVAETFGKILTAANIPEKSSKSKPRLHDLRHRFAVKSLASCPDSRDRITRHMLALSTYMGHTHVEDTYWYLESTPELMGDIADKCQAYLQVGG